jgi:hypothetical protein
MTKCILKGQSRTGQLFKVYIMKVSLAQDDCYKDYVTLGIALVQNVGKYNEQGFDGETLIYLLFIEYYFKWGFMSAKSKKKS